MPQSAKKIVAIIAPNSFKGSINAVEAARIIGKAFTKADSRFEVVEMPIADGGDHFAEVMTHALGGELRECATVDALGQEVTAVYGLHRQKNIAVVEMARASGLALLKETELDPLKTSSFGTGLLIKNALDEGCRHILLGIGGSATNDAGTGILQALGFRFLNENGNELRGCGGNLGKIFRIDSSNADPRLQETTIRIACDVENPLLGENGCARVFAPQKGASEQTVAILEQHMAAFCKLMEKHAGKALGSMPRGGAAGGIAAGLHAFLQAELVNGIDLVLQELGFEEALAKAQLVVTAEGKLDQQTLEGKGPYGIAQKAKAAGKMVVAFAGAIPSENLEAFTAFDALFSIVSGPMPLQQAIEKGPGLLYTSASQAARLIAASTRLNS